jgi:hypothetical protein
MYRSHARVMGLVNRCSLLQRLLWERNWVWTHGPVSQRVVDWDESPFLGAVDPFNSVEDFTKGCHI